MKTAVTHARSEEFHSMIDRGTTFGNPFILGVDGNREEVIKKYRKYFYWRIKWDKEFKKNVQRLKGKKLGCWCKPLACHGDVIVEYLEGE